MLKRIVAKKMMDRERDPAKLREVLRRKGYPDGKAPTGHHAHHKTPVAEGGKTTVKNITIVSKAKHKAIHRNNRLRGGI